MSVAQILACNYTKLDRIRLEQLAARTQRGALDSTRMGGTSYTKLTEAYLGTSGKKNSCVSEIKGEINGRRSI